MYRRNGVPMYRGNEECLRIVGVGVPTYRGSGSAYV